MAAIYPVSWSKIAVIIPSVFQRVFRISVTVSELCPNRVSQVPELHLSWSVLLRFFWILTVCGSRKSSFHTGLLCFFYRVLGKLCFSPVYQDLPPPVTAHMRTFLFRRA